MISFIFTGFLEVYLVGLSPQYQLNFAFPQYNFEIFIPFSRNLVGIIGVALLFSYCKIWNSASIAQKKYVMLNQTV